MNHEDIVRELWTAYENRDWRNARGLLAEDAVMTWPCTRERFHGADAIIHVNAVYPEGWHITLLECARMEANRIVSVVRVDHSPDDFFANSHFHVRDGVIVSITECRSTIEAAPAWRVEGTFPGYEMLR
ncbi:MAG: nuclear transport factor 2 family protein [Janthinobacterium lividum]